MKIFTVFALLFLSVLAGAQADLTIVSNIQSADIQASETGNMTMKLSNGKVRVDAGPAHIVMLPAEKKMLVIVDAQKMVMVKTLDDSAASSPNGGEPPSIERTGKTETINGYNCQQILLKDKKGRVTELWVSATAPDMAQFASSFKALVNANPRKSGYDWTGVMNQKDLNTYPLRTIHYSADGKEEMRITVLSIKEGPLPASDFAAPAGYMQMNMPDFGGMGGTDIGGGASSPENMKKMQDMLKQMQSK